MKSVPSQTIERPYLLVCPIAHRVDAEGSVWLEQLWHRDLSEHLTYLRHLVLVSPRLSDPAPAGWVRVSPPPDGHFEVVAIPSLGSFAQAMRNLPRLICILWKAIGRVEIVHSGVAGWPIAIGWVANPIALLRGKKLIIVVESAFWRILEDRQAGWKARFRNSLTERLGRFYVNRAHVLWFTQPSYRDSLLTWGQGKAWIIPATWINEEDVLSAEEAEHAWDRKSKEVRILFAGRLVTEKGIDVLLAALRKLDEEAVELRVDIIGKGPRLDACVAAAAALRTVKCTVIPPVPYGSEFFSIVRECHAVLIPSISDEQPRLVFDAFSQAVPVLASRTDGLAANVIEGKTGRLFASGHVDSLAAALRAATADVAELRRLGMHALEVARVSTHKEMHRLRCRILAEYLGGSSNAKHD